MMTGSNKGHRQITTFDSWAKVPSDEWRTKPNWIEVSRKVTDGEKPTGRVISTSIVSGLQMVAVTPDNLLYEDDDCAWIIDKEIPLFHVSQTYAAKISRRTLARLKYFKIFYRHARKDQYITRQSDPDTGKEGWTTISANASGDAPWKTGALSEDHLRKHLNHTVSSVWIDRKPVLRHTIGIKSTDETRFVAIDLDNHAKDDTEVFIKRAEVLLSRFYGGGWHYQLRDGAVTGIHFIKVFEKAIALDDARNQVSSVLKQLDQEHPDLHICDVEVFPHAEKGFRLPLARGYLMILDRILDPIMYRKQKAGDVEAYMDWLEDKNRAYFPKDRLLSYFRMNADDHKQPEKATAGIAVPSQLGSLRNCCWAKITGFWLGNFNPRNSLDAVIGVTARMALFFGHAAQETITTIRRFARELPAEVYHCSSRLITYDWREIDRCIAKEVARAYKGNSGQPDVEQSNTKLQAAVAAWSKRGLDILDKSTWDRPLLPQQFIKLTEDDRRIINLHLASRLGPAKYHHLACDIAIAMAQLVQHKMQSHVPDIRHKALSYSYWREFLEDRFGIRMGNRNKVAAFLKAAKELGIIATWCCSSKVRRQAEIYEVGQRMKKYMQVDKKTEEHQELPYNGSILFEYHFLEDTIEDAVTDEANSDEGARLLLGQDVWADASAWV